MLKLSRPSRILKLLSQPRDSLVQQRQGPPSLVDSFGGPHGPGVPFVNAFSHRGVERKRHLTCASLLSLLPIPFVGQESFERDQKEGAKFAFFRRHHAQVISESYSR